MIISKKKKEKKKKSFCYRYCCPGVGTFTVNIKFRKKMTIKMMADGNGDSIGVIKYLMQYKNNDEFGTRYLKKWVAPLSCSMPNPK